VLARIGLVQRDPSRTRAFALHAAFSRLGRLRRGWLEPGGILRIAADAFRYWPHEQSLVRGMPRCLRWRMDVPRHGEGNMATRRAIRARRRAFIEACGGDPRPRTARRLRAKARRFAGRGSWWGWSRRQRWRSSGCSGGEITTVTRRNFGARVRPDGAAASRAVLALADADRRRRTPRARPASPHRALARWRPERDLRDYFPASRRGRQGAGRRAGESGCSCRWSSEGWTQGRISTRRRKSRAPRCPKRYSPLIPLVWDRQRTERLFGSAIAWKILHPPTAHESTHGYYVLPFLSAIASSPA